MYEAGAREDMSTSENEKEPEGAEKLVEELKANEKGDALAKLVHALALSAFDERRTELEQGLADAAERLGLDEASSETSHGNVLRALKKGALVTLPERTLLGVLLAKGVALAPPEDGKSADRALLALAWAAANTPADALAVLDAVMGDGARVLWGAAGRLLAREAETPSSLVARSQAIVIAVALGGSTSEAAREARTSLAKTLRDPLLSGLIGRGGAGASGVADGGEPVSLKAEVVHPPRSFPVLFVLTATLLLPLFALAKLVARYAFQLKRPAELRVSDDGVRVQSRYELLGKTLRESELFIPTGGLARAARDVRYPRLATYVGIATLLLGSYVGLRLVIDGARAGAPEFLGIGLCVLLVALVVDYGLSRVGASSKGKCQLHFQSKSGAAISLAVPDRVVADRALSLLAKSR